MIKCLNGRPKYLLQMIPVAKYFYVKWFHILLIQSNDYVIAIIYDNNRTNQSLKHDIVSYKPWVTKNLFAL